ncbi:MAG: response regulator [Promethearchaeota archaeon]|jgi:CheY-like chemotaxis protein
MEPLILLVEDDPNILKYLKMTLEYNKCQVIIAENGMEGLKALSELESRPDLIISDILMPEMDGYNFFDAVSNNPVYCDIPFIFLSALDSPEDIRLGKILGVDDYITKPINEDDLLATIAGKIKRSKTASLINKKINEILVAYESENKNIPEKLKDLRILIEVEFDDIEGPKIVNQYPKDISLDFSLKKIGEQLYDGVVALYGQETILAPDGLLVPIKNINLVAYAFYDSYPDPSYRGGRKQIMFSFIAPTINYLQSLEMKQVFNELSSKYEGKKDWDMEMFWNKFSDILNKSSIETHLV